MRKTAVFRTRSSNSGREIFSPKGQCENSVQKTKCGNLLGERVIALYTLTMKIGYARISTTEQNLSLQTGALEKTDCGKVLHDQISGDKLIFHIFGALAEFERNLIQERTYARLAAARVRGRTGGQPKALDAKKTALLYRLYDKKKHSIQGICD